MTHNPIRKTVLHASGQSPTVAGVQSELLIADRVLNDGEQIILMVKPSAWFILLRSFRQIFVLLALGLALSLVMPSLQTLTHSALGALAGVQLLWTTCQWLGRLYVLTDQRLLRIDGLFSPSSWGMSLDELEQVTPQNILGEGLFGLGSLGLGDSRRCLDCWVHLNDPAAVAEEIQRAAEQFRKRRNT